MKIAHEINAKTNAMNRIFFLLSIGLLLFAGCKSKKNLKTENIEPEINQIQVARLGDLNQKSDPIQIDSVYISGNTMTLRVTYGGGCEEHEFELVGSEMISKSLPPIRSIKLIHNAKEDKCRALVIKDIQFDIKALTYVPEKGSEIFLVIDGYKERVKYTFE